MKTLSTRFSELLVLMNALPDPGNYYQGVGGKPAEMLPGGVICFARLSRKALALSHRPASHHRYVYIIAVKGEGTVCVDAANYRLSQGAAILICPYQYHSYRELDASFHWLFLTFEAGHEHWREQGNAVHEIGEMEVQLLTESVRCFQEPPLHRLLPWHLGLLLERMRLLPGHHREARKGKADLLVKVNEYALPRLHRPFPIEELAQAIGISESHLRSKFRHLTGQALGGHLRQLRLQRACALLNTTQDAVGNIAEACGFDSVYSFSRAFKAAHGLSPRAYRGLQYF